MRKQHAAVRYQLTCFFLFCVVLYLACKKSEQTIPATTVPVTKNFFELPKNVDPVVSGIINALNRENEKFPFAEAMVKNAGYPQWEYAVKKSSTSFREEITNQVINVPLVKSGDKKTSAVLTVNISNNDTTYGLAYPQQYILYNLDDSSGRQLLFARDFFNVFASFDHALFGTTQYFVNDGRIFGFERNDTLLVTVRYGENQGERQQPGAVAGPNTAGVTVCTTTTSCVYAGSPSPLRANEFVVPGTTSTGKCMITSSCISIITGGGDGGSTAPTSPTSTSGTTTAGGSTSTTNTTTTATPGSTNTSIPTLTSAPCVRIADNNARLPVTDPCGSQPWMPVTNEYTSVVTYLATALELTSEQKNWLINNSDVGNTINELLKEYGLSSETRTASVITIDAARNSLIKGPFDIDHYSKIQSYLPNSSQFSTGTISPIYWIHFMAQCAMIRADHPEWSTLRVYWEATSEIIHTGLDIIGMVPVVGEIADLTNGILYTIEGDGVNASLSFAATLPVAGWAATTAKYAKKTIYALDGTKRTLKWLKKTGDIIDFGDRNLLRKILGLTDSQIAHHIIPWEMKEHKLIQKLAKNKNALHLNERYNGIALIATQHAGSHSEYNARVLRKLDEIFNMNLSDDDAFREVKNLIDRISSAINSNINSPINNIVF